MGTFQKCPSRVQATKRRDHADHLLKKIDSADTKSNRVSCSEKAYPDVPRFPHALDALFSANLKPEVPARSPLPGMTTGWTSGIINEN